MVGSIMGLVWLVMDHIFDMISYVGCDMDSYMPGGGVCWPQTWRPVDGLIYVCESDCV